MEVFSNFAQTTTTQSITSAAGNITFTVASATKFPAISAGNKFRVLIDTELMLVSTVSGSTFTVLSADRPLEGTTRAAHASGATISHVLTSGSLLQAIADRAAPITADQSSIPNTTDGTASIGLAYRELYDELGAIVMEWGSGAYQLNDSSSARSVDWNGRLLINSSGATGLNYNNSPSTQTAPVTTAIPSGETTSVPTISSIVSNLRTRLAQLEAQIRAYGMIT